MVTQGVFYGVVLGQGLSPCELQSIALREALSNEALHAQHEAQPTVALWQTATV